MSHSDAGKTILLVDDEPEIRRLLRGFLSKKYKVIEAESGAEALKVVAGGTRIDLLITDILMPGMNGSDLANKIVSVQPDLPVLFISGYVPERDALDRFAGAKRAFLAKPFALAAILEKVSEMTEDSRSVRVRAPRNRGACPLLRPVPFLVRAAGDYARRQARFRTLHNNFSWSYAFFVRSWRRTTAACAATRALAASRS